MALSNGVLVHGPDAWACAIRTPDGELKVVARPKKLRASQVRNPVLRGPARIAEVFALLPQVKRALPEAELPLERPRVVGAMLGSAFVLQVLRRAQLRPVARELLSGLLSVAPAPRTTGPSTFRSAATSTEPIGPRSTSAAARTSSARCC